jgi:hypothetical protein
MMNLAFRVSLIVLTWKPIYGRPEYAKYHNKALDGSTVYAVHKIQKIFECEVICSDHGAQCVAANMYYYGTGSYGCELIKRLPDNLMLIDNKMGKTMTKIGT